MSEKGRQDAFRRGEQIPAPRQTKQASMLQRVIDRNVDPELFERATALDLTLDVSGTVAHVPIGCPHDDGNHLWRPIDGEAPWVNHGLQYLTEFTQFDGVRYWVPDSPAKRSMLPDVIRDAVTDHLELAKAENEWGAEHFINAFAPFDAYLSTEELIASEESARATAHNVAAAFDDQVEEMWEHYKAWLLATRNHLLELFDDWMTSAEADIDTSEFDGYRDRLAALEPPVWHGTVVTLFVEEPTRLVRLRSALEAAARSASELARAAEWTREFGSTRLQRIESEGLLATSMSVYRDERLVLERPGWGWQDPKVTLRDPAAPTEEAFDLLDAARKLEPDSTLRFATLGKGSGRFVATAEFLGRPIWFPGDALADIEGAGR